MGDGTGVAPRHDVRRPPQPHDLHGSAADIAPVALLLIDVINDLEFDGGDALLGPAVAMADRLAALKRRARALGIPAIYVNDNFGRWQSDFRKLLAHCLEPGVRGRPLAERLAPGDDDYFVLKPKHSGFYSTTLELLLAYLDVYTVIVTGLTATTCVLFTAADAYMRDLRVVVPADCVASIDPSDTPTALGLMREVLHADVEPSDALDLETLVSAARAQRK
jgi:nicotinamidase-related amidase